MLFFCDMDRLAVIRNKILDGGSVGRDDMDALLREGFDKERLFETAAEITREMAPRHFDRCSIINAKSGLCSENCKWCAQSARYKTGAEIYPLLDKETCLKRARFNEEQRIERFSIVTSGKKPNREQIRQIELKFLAEGIIPVVQEEKAQEEPAAQEAAGEEAPEYIFSRHAMGRIPYIIVEQPEPEFDYTFKILGRNEGQFVEDNTLPEGVVYQIQFMVLSNHASVRDIRGMSPVFVSKMKSGKYLHTVGLFSTYQEASSNLGRVRRNGFPDAIIIAYNNGRSIPVKTARTMENERVLSMPASGGSRSGSASRQTSSAASGDMSYQVVLKGYGPALPSSVLSAIRGATTKDLTKSGSDDATVFAVGPFSERKDAEFLLKILEDLDIKNVSIESIKL